MSISFATDVAPLFKPKDVSCMKGFGVELDSYEYMSSTAGDAVYGDHANARHVLGHIAGTETPKMPLGGPYWSAANIDLLRQWLDSGCSP